MDLYEKKFAEMQKYIPFLEAMIERLKKVKDKSRESQLQKMQSLHGILSNSSGKKLTIEKLHRCEEVLLKLHNKVDKGNSSGTLQNVKKEPEDVKDVKSVKVEKDDNDVKDVKPVVARNLETHNTVTSSVDPNRGKDLDMYHKRQNSQRVTKKEEEETPASPSPPASPDQGSHSRVTSDPIIIPTERSDGFTGTASDDRPASPDPCELIATIGMRKPIIIPTERAENRPVLNPLRRIDSDPPSKHIPTLNNYSDNKHSIPQNTNLWQPQRRTNVPDRGPSALRHISTVPAPSKGANLIRKPVLILDKKASEIESPTSKWDSPQSNVSSPRLISPDRDSHNQRSSITSPKSKDLQSLPKLPPTPLLVSPPPVLRDPPLTQEDLAELLQDESDNRSAKKPQASKEKDSKVSERLTEEGKKSEKVPSIPSTGSNRDGKPHKTINLTQDDVDPESERRWEEEYRHIVKMPSRRIFTSPSGTPTKHSDSRGSSNSRSINNQSERPTDPRNRPSTPSPKERDPPVNEPRYADNYEKHPRGHPRDSHQHNSIADMNPINSAFSRNSHNDPNNCDDRSPAHYQQRSYGGNPVHIEQPTDLRRENVDFYRGMMRDRDNQQNPNRPPMLHSPGRSGDPCNQSQWNQNPNYQSPPQGPNMQYQQRPDMWTMKAGPNNMDSHMMSGDPSYIRPPHYPTGQNSCGRPMMSPQDMNHGPCMDQGLRDNMPNQAMIPPLIPSLMPQMGQQPHPSAMMQPQGYPSGSQYRNFPPENRQNVQQFDRPQDFPHPRQTWDQQQPINRPPESYPRPPGPGQWNRPNRGGPPAPGPAAAPPPMIPGVQGNRERNFNDRNRGDSARPAGFNRDPRTRIEAPAIPANSNPRPRVEASLPSQGTIPSSTPSNVRREQSRFSKDIPQSTGSKTKESLPADRNARRKPDNKDTSKHNASRDPRKSNEIKRTSYTSEKKGRRETENDSNKTVSEKPSKDVMQSPLESLYGVIDTAAKTGKGYGIQNFKIPKIRRSQPAPSPPRTVEDTVEENWDLPDESSVTIDESSVNKPNEAAIVEEPQPNRNESDDKKAEVTSTTCENSEEPTIVSEVSEACETSVPNETPAKSTIDSATIDTSTKNTEETAKHSENKKDSDELLDDDSLTALTAKAALSFLQTLSKSKNSKELQKLIKQIKGNKIDEEDCISSEAEEPSTENKKSGNKKKRRVVIMSDSSEEECLAERLGIKKGANKPDDTEENNENKTKASDSATNEDSSAKIEANLPEDGSQDTQDDQGKKTKPFRRKRCERKGKSDASSKEQNADTGETPAEVDEDPDAKIPSPKPPPTKTKLRRRNSLEMLQEDVREMFISEGVVTANGHRMCRLIKEAQAQSSMANNLDSSVENLSAEKSKNKKGSTSSLDRQGAKTESDGDEAIQAPPPASNRGKGGRGRSRRRTRGRGGARQSLKEIASSDSEEEGTSRLENTPQNDASETIKASDESGKSESVGDNSKNSKDESEETYFLRRSERVGLRESMKEPRVHLQKSELGKIDSSKIMFDSSSDESFGIDVSELTAAVDISLHPEPQALTSSSPLAKPLNTKTAAIRKKMMAKKQGSVAKAAEDKIENVASGDEVESIASDLSRASSLTRGKKASAPSNKLDTNEEMLSDLLTGLVDSKTSGVANEIERDAIPAVDGKATRRKKKKKPSWSLGIVKNKKRKKKLPLAAAAETEFTEAETADIAELELSFEATSETKIEPDASPTKTNASLATECEPKEEILSDSSVPKSAEENADNAAKETFAVHKEEPQSPVKSQTSSEREATNLDDTLVEDKPPVDELSTALSPEVSRCDVESELGTHSVGRRLGARKLMSYIWTTRRERFKCLYCHWIGKNIVHHYTITHSGKEVMISRFSNPESRRAINQAMIDDYVKMKPNTVTKEIRKFTCRFCVFTSEGSSATAIEAFYEHCTTHTGEYRFRCNGCPYQTVARSSMRTHYYRKTCPSKDIENVRLAISEDPVPDEDFVCGYICTKCNFVQLKESNMRRHIKLTHEPVSGLDMVKINMSSFVEEDLYKNPTLSSATDELKIEGDPPVETEPNASATNERTDDPSSSMNITGTLTEGTDQMNIIDESLKNEEDTGKTAEPTSSQEESPVIAGNLSAFVCPPELENKEAEIQHERIKKMQEIVENIGILNKVNEKRDLSIIDKLKDKMTTDLDESLEAARSLEENKEIAASETNEVPAVPSMNLPVLVIGSVTSIAEESNSNGTHGETSNAETTPEASKSTVKDEPSDPTCADGLKVSKEEDGDRAEKKLKDPLTNLDELRKDDSSDGEDTDNDNATQRPRSYESDSTDEQSDCEIHTDVNFILGGINRTTNAPIMTTIQRLAAQLHAEKSFPVGEATADTVETSGQELAELIPKAPKTIPISCVQRIIGKRNAVLQEVAKEVMEKESPEKPPASPPKKFIRLRRLSGDKLSVQSPVEPSPVASPSIGPSRSSSVDESTSDVAAEVIPTDNTEEGYSFLRIENVISLAGVESTTNEPAVHDVVKTVGNPNIKTPTPVSILKKGNVNILRRSVGNMPVAGKSSTITNLAVLPIQPGLALKNAKIMRIVGRTSLKQKDSTHRIFGTKLKTPEMFTAMLKYAKLRQFYKCMARNCSYTTDCQQSFGRHYRRHKETVDRSKAVLVETYDFQRCAYCTETLSTWNAMSEHLRDKHMYCQFQCSYCFYRALAQSYVELHQLTVHQDLSPSVLLGQRENPPIEVIDRREFVIPFVCHHECGKSFYVPNAFLAHLRTKHGNSLSIFKCHLCPAPLFNAEKLIAHYKLHGIYKYQCLYCLFGSEQAADVHAHLSASHYNRPPHILERTLQPQPVRDKDVIQQLIVHNVDETYKCTELVLAPGQRVADIPKNKHWLQVDKNMSEPLPGRQIKLPIGNIGINRLFTYEKLDSTEPGKSGTTSSAPTTPIMTNIRKSAKPSPENMLIMDDSGDIMKISKRREIVFTSPTKDLTSDDPSMDSLAQPLDPLETSCLSISNEEFVNLNILDDPSFLDGGESASIAANRSNLEDTENKNDDSDIEILEDIREPANKQNSNSVKNAASQPETAEESVKIKVPLKKEETSVSETPEAEPVIVCSSAENSLETSIDPPPTEEPDNTFVRPLTLEDIKNTGFTGRDLYRCGYDNCEYGAETSELLRHHIKECIFATETSNINCMHCSKRFVKIGFLLEHLKLHGLKRFGCSLCKDRWPMSSQAMTHMKTKHRQNAKMIPADPKNPSATGLFVVEADSGPRDRSRGKKRGRIKSMDKDGEKVNDAEKLSFGPTEIDSLPRQPIYLREVQCKVCPFTTKVRTNIIRHLQLHAKDETVPESGPVNPVPCLDKKEKMFDKMVNLASSSHQNGRMGGMKIKEAIVDNDAEFLPKFIPEHKRYVCGVTECNYLSIDELMLRAHLKALHPDEPYFRCPHCPAQVPGHEAQNIAIDKMGIHLKMHDTRLYKCSHCNHHHYHRHVVERHLTDKHSEANPYVKVIREPESTETVQQQTSQEEGEEGSADPEGNHWKCNVCEYKCVYKSDMVSHATSSHEEKAQFKCSICQYKTSTKINIDQHLFAKHGTDPTANFTMIYQKIKGVGGTKRPAEVVELGPLSEPFDTTPLWRRDNNRVRHIRGILFEDEDIVKPGSSPVKSGKRKSDVEISAKPAKLKPGKIPSNDDTDSLWNSSLETSSSDKRYDLTDDFIDVESLVPTAESLEPSRLVRKFAPYGSPIAQFYRCTICQTFKTKYKHDMRDHLYRDLKYLRYRCSVCGYTGVNKNSALKHFMRLHENRRPTEDEQKCLPVNFEIETWVQTLLKSQTAQMRGMSVDANGNIKQESLRPRKAAPPKTNTLSITQSPLKNTSLKAKTVDLTQAITAMKNKSMVVETDLQTQNLQDADSNDNDALVIDSKDDGLEEQEVVGDSTLADDGEPNAEPQHLLACKHCTMKFPSLRGLKQHVQIRHLRRLAFICPYCDTSSNSDIHLKKHIALKHVGRPETMIRNPATNLPELPNEFWEKEYGAIIPEKRKKRKRAAETETSGDQFEKTSGGHVCNVCGFRAINIHGLGVHMRVHTAPKNFKCAYCSFAAAERVHLWQHSEINHGNLDWKAGNGHGPVPGTSEENVTDEMNIEQEFEDSNDYIELHRASTSNEVKLDLMYACYHCGTQRKSIEAVKEHWKTAHKTLAKVPSDSTGQAMPFRYKEVAVHPLKKILRCGYCPKRGSAASIRMHSRKKHATKPLKFVEIPIATATPSPPAVTTISVMPVIQEGWICRWCKEFCDSEAKKKVHQNMFHSHLPASFKRQENPCVESDAEASNCPECSFKTSSLTIMQKHVAKHLDSSRCTSCDITFPDVTVAINHNRQAHRGEISKIESFVPNIEKIMAKVVWKNGENSGNVAIENPSRFSPNIPRSQGVAKKSTTKSLLRVNPTPTDYRAVARKSTNPLPRYPPGIRFNTDGLDTIESRMEEAVSYYGKPRVPVNLADISTYITLAGGRQMKLTCTALAQLFDIEPRVLVEDIKKNHNGSA